VADPADGRQRIPAQSPFEEAIGFTRAIRTGNAIAVSGTVGVEADGSVEEECGAQADRCFALIRQHIEQLGGHIGDVVRVRMFVTDMADADAASAAFSRALGATRPAATLVAIAGLYDPRWKIEIEADAVIGSGQ
jgi:enamine deaminase RidA (YjgF/YER057c/UK114 family)